jgi:hypothetical protein
MSRLVDDAIARFGRIDGVVHSAGIAGGGMIQLKTTEGAAAVLTPKVAGTRVLARVFEGREPDFMVLCSSLTSVLGGLGQVDYCGANAYLDAFARQHGAQSKAHVVAINWNAWREVGMAVDTSIPEDVREALRTQMLASGISNAQGVDAFCRILDSREAQVAISPHEVGLILDDRRAPKEASAGDEITPSAVEGRAQASSERQTGGHARPNLQSAFVAPRNDVEGRICAVWQDSLGIDRVGIDDNFFDLGGHSLLAVRVMARVNEVLGSDIPVAKLYEGLTVRFLAGLVGSPDQTEAASDEDAELMEERRREKARRQKEHQLRRREVMRR